MEQVLEKVLDENRLNSLLGKMVNDVGAAAMGTLIILGDKLNLYKTLAGKGPLSSDELADATNTSERYVREWLSAQAASGYIEYDKDTNRFFMHPEQAAVFAEDESPVLMTGGFYSISSMYHDEPKVREAFKTGKGVTWDNHHNCLFCGVEKFYGPSYRGNLVSSWIPALYGVEEKLKAGAKVADIGCGHGVATLLMAEAYPNSEFIGYDIHEESVNHANHEAAKLGLKNVVFEAASAKSYPKLKFDLITFFDALHDMGDPDGAAAYALKALDKKGTCTIVEPFANDNLHENLTPVGRAFYASSTMVCTPTALSQGGTAIGAQAGRKKLTGVLTNGGFTKVKVAVETPFNLIFEAKP
ncbi:MAG: class I SAM-dependent methyltransferase [Ignavibacteriales bacterium]|nr:MAG: class I SAM-dependent methyltransferase [Ignavibacteriales bacterium]